MGRGESWKNNCEKQKKIAEKWKKNVKNDSGNVLLAIGFPEISFGICPFQ